MRYSAIKDRVVRSEIAKKEFRHNLLRAVKVNKFLPVSWRVASSYKLGNFEVYKSKLQNFCIYTFRSKGLIREFGMSRHMFKKNVNQGLVPGFKKSSW